MYSLMYVQFSIYKIKYFINSRCSAALLSLGQNHSILKQKLTLIRHFTFDS